MKKIYKIIILVLVFMGLSLCLIFNMIAEADRREKVIAKKFLVYSFDPDVALASEINTLVILGEGEEAYDAYLHPEEFASPVQWTQEDFLTVADKLVKSYSDSQLESWRLHDMTFLMECTDTEFGVQQMYLTMFQDGNKTEEKMELNISVLPQSELLTISEYYYSPYLGGEHLISWNKIKIPAEKVLEIAEMNRMFSDVAFDNNYCKIRLSLIAGIQNNDWHIVYTGNEGTLFEAYIDEKTGKQKIIKDWQ